ncbi:MAG TPA: transcription antitermination factor NusB [Acholeplasmataceae bacterium]|nr:transcription antitermination factor NusB [Acholeplasmataceae bacterium]
MKRTNSRIMAMIVLYNYEITNEINIKSIEEMIDDNDFAYDKDFTSALIKGILENTEEIDYIISTNLENYTIDRLSYIDRNLIRIGVFEMMKTDTPKNIIINEIIEISKIFTEISGYQTSKFNNALLDKIAQRIYDGK